MTYYKYISNLPMSVRGFVVKHGDDYTVVINPAMSHDIQTETLYHEIKHIKNDFHADLDVDSTEAERHK